METINQFDKLVIIEYHKIKIFIFLKYIIWRFIKTHVLYTSMLSNSNKIENINKKKNLKDQYILKLSSTHFPKQTNRRKLTQNTEMS